jgi:hypothetical protein
MMPIFLRGLTGFLLAASVLILSGCGSSSPEAAAEGFYQAIAANDVDLALSFISMDDLGENDMRAVQGKMHVAVGFASQEIAARGGVDSVTTKVVEQNGDRARVSVTITCKDGEKNTQTLAFIQKDGWKLDPIAGMMTGRSPL